VKEGCVLNHSWQPNQESLVGDSGSNNSMIWWVHTQACHLHIEISGDRLRRRDHGIHDGCVGWTV